MTWATTQQTISSGYGRTGPRELSEHPNIIVTKNGSVLTSQLREVCRDCNGGWMSQLETSVQPILAFLWKASRSFGQLALLDAEIATLTAWSLKTAWVRDRLDSANHSFVATTEMRRALATTGLPPANTAVCLGRYGGQPSLTALTARLTLTNGEAVWNTTDVRTVLECLLVVNNIVLMVRTDDGDGAPARLIPPITWSVLWPSPGHIVWPPSCVVSDREIHRLRTDYSWIEHPDGHAFRRQPDGWRHLKRN